MQVRSERAIRCLDRHRESSECSEEYHGRARARNQYQIALQCRRKSPRAAINDCYLTHIFDDLRFGAGREGQLALVGQCRHSTNPGAARTLGVFHPRGRRSHRSARRPADPAGPADTGGQGCRMCGLHRPATCGTVWQGRAVIYARALRRWNAATGQSISPLTPAARYRQALAALDKYCRSKYAGKSFVQLPDGDKDKLLSGLEKGEVQLEGTSGRAFFELLLRNTQEGFFADPVYGGNRNMVAWKMIGYPGAHYDYRDWVERHNQPYPLPPLSVGGRPE